MNFQLLADLRDAVKECMDPCEYKHFVSLGKPSAECNSIAFWYDSATGNAADNGDCRTDVFDTSIVVTMTRCCANSDTQIDFDTAAEEKEALCFLTDLETLIQCLSCGAGSAIADDIMSCGVIIEDIQMDGQKMGGCYSVDISLEITNQICCTEEEG